MGSYPYASYPRAFALMISGKSSSSYSAEGMAWVLDTGTYCAATGTNYGGQIYGHYSINRVFKYAGATAADDVSLVAHELGHNFYQRAYKNQDLLFKNGANDGFHEAIGDFIALSITPEYLKQIGLITKVPSADADIGLLMDRALEKVAFLPFGLKVDKWRWQIGRAHV